MRVTSKVGHMRGLEEITGAFDKSKVALILACGVHKYNEYQNLLGKRAEKDIISYRQLNKKFGTNKVTLMEVAQGYKYRYLGGVSTKVPGWSQNTVPIAPTQAAIKGIVQYSTEQQKQLEISQ